ncbi:hypothetical protein TNCT_478861 [Trichonephila clavata]|uniref:Uncharacterized protein n=1 Tax=Trichonephila clavata TaxID=2740835 RepID=A0A8X6G541_TRICU|nr:hypothetical protein TNCT_9881 [Trichonephila clavata]GFQ96502.1 hypothetical protein TNCT_256321 [Trichonephila clavata]GFR00978.1 hypothetical protein TNCT_583221 [Trichonephila clavata]GFR22892.1 hypothetical protein TNCT_478861 [Trichonephila clavata]
MKRTPLHPTQLAHRPQYGRWRSGQNKPPMGYSRNQVYYPQRPAFSILITHPLLLSGRPCIQSVSQQRPADLRPDAPTFQPSQRLPENNTII